MNCDYFVACRGLSVWPLDGFQPIERSIQKRLNEGYVKVFEGEGWFLLNKPAAVQPVPDGKNLSKKQE